MKIIYFIFEVKTMSPQLTQICLIIDTTSQDKEECLYFSYKDLPIAYYYSSVDLGQAPNNEEGKTSQCTIGLIGTYSFKSKEEVIKDLCGFLRLHFHGNVNFDNIYVFARSANLPKPLTDKYYKCSEIIVGRKCDSNPVRPYEDILRLYHKAATSTEPEIKIKDFMNVLAYPWTGLDEAESYISRVLTGGGTGIEISQSEIEVLNTETSLGKLNDYKDFGGYAKEVRNAVTHYQRKNPDSAKIDLCDPLQAKQLEATADILGRFALYKITHSHEWYHETDGIYHTCEKKDIWWLNSEFLNEVDELWNDSELMVQSEKAREKALVKDKKSR